MELFKWAMDHWDGIMAFLTALHALAVAFINLTRTPDCDDPMRRPYRAVEMFAGILTDKAKQ